MTNKSVILLSGGLDSAVSLAKCIEDFNIKLALFFDYGQKSFVQEKIAVQKLIEYYGIKLEVIDLPWLKNITKTSLVNDDISIPSVENEQLDDFKKADESASKVWVPNRNGVFINIAAAYCDSYDFNKIIIGANKEEGATFPDNSAEFIKRTNIVLEFSTKVKPEVVAPLIDLEKYEIIQLGKSLNLPFEFIRSCYSNFDYHCGKCESCKRLRRGLERANLFDIVNLIFDNKEKV